MHMHSLLVLKLEVYTYGYLLDTFEMEAVICLIVRHNSSLVLYRIRNHNAAGDQ